MREGAVPVGYVRWTDSALTEGSRGCRETSRVTFNVPRENYWEELVPREQKTLGVREMRDAWER